VTTTKHTQVLCETDYKIIYYYKKERQEKTDSKHLNVI
jgi:hypothetical protein